MISTTSSRTVCTHATIRLSMFLCPQPARPSLSAAKPSPSRSAPLAKRDRKFSPVPAGPKQATVPVATPEAVATVDEESYGRWQQWQGGLSYLQRLLRAGALTNVNRYDVSCFKE